MLNLGGQTYLIMTNKPLPAGAIDTAATKQEQLLNWLKQRNDSPIASVTTPSGQTLEPGRPGYNAFAEDYSKHYGRMMADARNGILSDDLRISPVTSKAQVLKKD
jgi:hypothetical protein